MSPPPVPVILSPFPLPPPFNFPFTYLSSSLHISFLFPLIYSIYNSLSSHLFIVLKTKTRGFACDRRERSEASIQLNLILSYLSRLSISEACGIQFQNQKQKGENPRPPPTTKKRKKRRSFVIDETSIKKKRIQQM